MANNKDFLVNGPVSVGKDTKVTIGSITSSDIDLSTGNYFADTLAANTTYTLSNAGAVQAFQLEVTGGAASIYTVSGASYDSKAFSVTAQGGSPLGIAFKPDGTKMYVTQGGTTRTVSEYALSTAWVINTASYTTNKTLGYSDLSGIFFKPDGTTMYVLTYANDSVAQISLSTAWDVSTAGVTGTLKSVSAQETFPVGIAFKPDGTKMYVCGTSSNSVHEYNLSTAWSVSSASFNQSYSVSSEGQSVQGVAFSTDGTKMFVSANLPDSVFEYDLNTAWDISTASYSSITFSFSSQDTIARTIAFKPDGTKLYLIGDANNTVFQYSSGGTEAYTITWPSSIEWAGGVAPAAPANGETDVFTFVTDDSGTTYTGVKSIDNAS